LTLEGWVNFSSVPSNVQVLFGKTAGTGTSDSYVVWYQSGQLHATTGTAGFTGPILNINWTPTPGQWYHIAFTYDASAVTETLYIHDSNRNAGALTSATDMVPP